MLKFTIVILLAATSALAQTKDTSGRDLVSVTFANLGTPSNGRVLYCSDCTRADPTAGSGSGAVVRRENGAWNGGATSVSPSYLTPAFSAAPTPACAAGGVGTTLDMTLTGAVTSIAPSGCVAGQRFRYILRQNGTGNWAVACGASFTSCDTVEPTASKYTTQLFEFNGTAFDPVGPSKSDYSGAPYITSAAGNKITFTDAVQTVVGRDTTDTLTNKTISGASNTLTVREADLSTTDVTTANATTSKHGFVPKLPNDATKYYDGTGSYSVPAGSGGGSVGPVVSATNATPFTFTANTWATVTWDTTSFDTSGGATMHSTSSNTSRLVAPTTGYYLAICAMNFDVLISTQGYARIIKNGSTATVYAEQSGGTYPGVTATIVMSLAASDYIECQGQTGNNGAANGGPSNSFQLLKLF